jgi:hypothetical protein
MGCWPVLSEDVLYVAGWWFQTWLLFSISYMGCHPKPVDELRFFKMVIAPPTSYVFPYNFPHPERRNIQPEKWGTRAKFCSWFRFCQLPFAA